MITAAARVVLVNNTAVKNLTGEHITFGIAEQNERQPRVVLTLVDTQHEHTMTAHAGYTTGRIQADCLAPDYQTAKVLAKAVIAALDGYEGPVSGIAWFTVGFIHVDSESDIPVAIPEGAGVPSTYGVSIDFTFMYTIP